VRSEEVLTPPNQAVRAANDQSDLETDYPIAKKR